jgi:cytochrome c oxidase subunit 2
MLLAPLIWLVAATVVALFAARRWWFPDPISAHAFAYDDQFRLTLWVCGIIFVAVHLALGFALLRYRRRGAAVRFFRGSTKLEWIWTLATTVLFVGLMLTGNRIWASLQFAKAPEGALKVEVLARQFAWSYRYPGPDGKFGRTKITLVNDAAANDFGIDPEDPAGKDDITAPVLRVPVGRPVNLTLRARDVIHNFFVRELRIKQDIVPGMLIPLTIQADLTGTYEIACSELCGLGHHQMRSTLRVLTSEQFEEWLAEPRQ